MGRSDDRLVLKNSTKIKLYKDTKNKTEEIFKIKKLIGSGGSVVCYLAENNGSIGKLKEFYPIDMPDDELMYSFVRSKNKNLLPVGERMRDTFSAMREQFVKTHDAFSKQKSELLNNYTKNFEIYYGFEDGKKCTAYMWIKDDYYGDIYNDALKIIHKKYKDPKEEVEKIIDIIKSLSNAVSALHSANYLHLDINPFNFKVKKISAKELGNDVDLFDLNSLYYMGEGVPLFKGTNGFCDPKISINNVSIQSDIYSLGAVLFYSLVTNENAEGRRYSEEDYNSLLEIIEQSAVMKRLSKKLNRFAYSSFLSTLVKIFEKTFSDSSLNKYFKCDAFAEDLQKAKASLSIEMIKADRSEKERLNKINSITQKFVYTHPFYKFLPDSCNEFNVLVIGSDEYAFNFTDNCLQFCQIPGKKLKITVLCNEPIEQLNNYLSRRPALKNFFTLNGKAPKGESYGEINFANNMVISKRFEQEDRFCFNMLLSKYKKAQYVFVSLGQKDSLNSECAQLCAEFYSENVMVSYAAFSKKKAGAEINVLPVYYDGVLKDDKHSDRVLAMALNAHSVWERNCGIASGEFTKKHNYNSSIAFVLSVKYKLWYMGIELNENNYQQCAEQFRQKYQKAPKTQRELAAMEHRRWVTEKIVNGWTDMVNSQGELDCSGILQRLSVYDSEEKRHPCIVKATSGNILRDYGRDKAVWQDESLDGKLDELDLVSVKLQRFYIKEAEKIDFSETNKVLKEIASQTSREAILAYNKYLFCVLSICNDFNIKYARLYESYETKLKNALIEVFESKKQSDKIFKDMRSKLYPALNACYFKNYKENDLKLIENIPFILTYKKDFVLALPFKFNSKEEILQNISSVMTIVPGKVVYFSAFDINKEKEDVLSAINSIKNFLDKRAITLTAEFIFGVYGADESKIEAFEADMYSRFGKRIKNKFKITAVKDEAQASAFFVKQLGDDIDLYDGTSSLFSSSIENYRFINKIIENKNKIGYFEFDVKKNAFSNTTGCEFLNFIKADTYIRVEDMFLLSGVNDTEFENMEYGDDYKTLWEIYTTCARYENESKTLSASVNLWNDLCAFFAEHYANINTIKKNTLATFSQKSLAEDDEKIEYRMPLSISKSIKKIIKKLKKAGAIKGESSIINDTTESCHVVIYPVWDVKEAFDNLSGKILYLTDENNIYFNEKSSSIYLLYNELTVDCLNIESRFLPLLNTLKEKGFINNIVENKFKLQDTDNVKNISFAYSSGRIKKLLTNAGKILEIYTYYECKKMEYFDDVACSCKINSSNDIENEFDVILTKGYRTMIVECKACKHLTQDYYHKLSSLATQFGIYPVRVIVANTHSESGIISASNKLHVSRGENMDIFTVASFNDIKDIGKKLCDIMKSVSD